MKMLFKKETKHTVVYAAQDDTAPVQSVYVEKVWLRRRQPAGWPEAIELEVTI